MVLVFCDSPHDPLSVYQVSLNYLEYFKRYAPDKCDGQMVRRTDKAANKNSPFLEYKKSLFVGHLNEFLYMSNTI